LEWRRLAPTICCIYVKFLINFSCKASLAASTGGAAFGWPSVLSWGKMANKFHLLLAHLC
jgi:hypothetical protein